MISDNGAILVGQDGGTLVGQDGSTLVGQDGSTLVGQDGSTLVGQDGSTLVGQDGSTLRISAAGLVGQDGSTRPADPFGLDWLTRGTAGEQEPIRPPSPLLPSDLESKTAGYVVASGAGGSEPTITYTYDDVTGDSFATVSLVLDNTSTPKVTNLRDLVFAVGMNPSVIKLQSGTVTASEGAGFAAITVVRTGDTSSAASFEYTTKQEAGVVACGSGTAGERCDYNLTLGAIQFAANETSKEIRVPIIDDKYAEGNETFKLILGNALGAAIQMPSAGYP